MGERNPDKLDTRETEVRELADGRVAYVGRSERSIDEALLRGITRYYNEDPDGRQLYAEGASVDLDIVLAEVRAEVVNPPRVGDYKIGVSPKTGP
jgi:hypothetical protein